MKPLVIGVGNRWRCDDSIGPLVVEALAAGRCDGVDLLVLDGEPARLMTAWEGRSVVVVVDAVHSGAEPGEIHRIDALGQNLRVDASTSTHGAGVADAVALARSLGRLPDRLVVIGVEAEWLGHGASLSPAVAAAFDDVMHRTIEEVVAACA